MNKTKYPATAREAAFSETCQIIKDDREASHRARSFLELTANTLVCLFFGLVFAATSAVLLSTNGENTTLMFVAGSLTSALVFGALHLGWELSQIRKHLWLIALSAGDFEARGSAVRSKDTDA